MQSKIEITCTTCNKVNDRSYTWINPSHFKTPDAATLTSSFFCKHCQSGIAVKLKFLPEGEIELKERLVFIDVLKVDEMPFYIGGNATDDDGETDKSPVTLTEDAALTLLNDIIDD